MNGTDFQQAKPVITPRPKRRISTRAGLFVLLLVLLTGTGVSWFFFQKSPEHDLARVVQTMQMQSASRMQLSVSYDTTNNIPDPLATLLGVPPNEPQRQTWNMQARIVSDHTAKDALRNIDLVTTWQVADTPGGPVETELAQQEKNLFFRIKTLPDLNGLADVNLNQYENRWIEWKFDNHVDPFGITQRIADLQRQFFEDPEAEQYLPRKKEDELKRLVARYFLDVFEPTTREHVMLEGRDTIRYTFHLDKSDLIGLLQAIHETVPNAFRAHHFEKIRRAATNAERTSAELLIDANNYLLRRATLETSLRKHATRVKIDLKALQYGGDAAIKKVDSSLTISQVLASILKKFPPDGGRLIDVPPNDRLTQEGEGAFGRDQDRDGLTDLEELKIYETDPTNPDTDGDGFNDGEEVGNGYNPNGNGRLRL